MEQKKIQKKNQKKIYAILAVLAVIAIAFIALAASGTITNWIAAYKVQQNYEEIIANKDNVTDEMTLRQLLLLDEELEITVTEDIEIKTGFTVNGQKTLRGDASIVANIGILQPISIMEVTNGSTLTMDGLVVDGNGIAVGIKVVDGAELTYLSGEIIYAGTYGIVANGVVTIEDVSISNCSTAAVDVGFNSKVYFNGGQFVNNRHIGVYVEAQGYMEINNDALIDGTSGQGIRNRGELVIHGGKFNNIGKFVVANHNVVTIDYTGTDGGYIEMSNIGQGVVYNQNTGIVDVKDVHATNIGTDAFKCTGGTMAVENCIVEKSKAHAFYISFGDVTIKDFKAIDMNLCGIYALSPAVITLENVEFENIGTRGIMSKGATITGDNVTIKNTGTFGVSNQVSSEGITSVNEYTNLSITGAGSNSVNISGGAKIVITDGVLGESPRTNVYVGNGEAVLNNVEIQGVATNKHAAISVSAKGTCTLDGDSKIHGNGVRAVNISGVFNMKGGEIYGYTSEKVMGAAVRLYKGGTFNMSGGSIHDNKASEAGAGAVHLNSNTTFNMTGGKIYGNTATTTGGAVQVSANSTFNMKGGSIYNNETLKYSGGAVYVLGKMNMSGGNIYENTSASVGGAINLNSATDGTTNKKVYGEFDMTGGKIYANKATTNGGALHVSGGTTANLTGGSMYDNVAGGRGDGVNNNGNATVSGSFSAGNNNFSLGGPKVVLRIKGNTLSSHSASAPFLLEPGNYSDIGTVVAECDSAEAAASLFKVISKETGSYKLAQDGKNIVVAGYTEADMSMKDADTVYVSTFQELKEAVEGTTSSRIVVICADIEMEGLITVPDATTVKLRDDGVKRTLSRAENTVSAFFTASFGTGLIIEPTQDGNLVLNGEGTNDAGKEFVQLMVVRGTTVIDGVVFKDNGVEGQTRDGAFISNKYGDLTITNSSFTGAYGNAGGAITVEKGVASISGSTFEENTSKYGGGAIRVKKDAELTLENTTFKNNNAGSVGGAINNDGGVLNVVNSTFEANKSIDGSGAINLTNTAVAEITGSTFDGNSTTATGNGKGGAAIKVNNGSDLVLDGSVFINNTTPDKGGAIAAEGKSSDGKYPTITATNTKFGVDKDGKAGANTAGAAGGAVFLGKYVEASFTEDCVFANNSSGADGGAIYTKGQTTVAGAKFVSNSAERAGAIWADAGESLVSLKDTVFESNTATNGTAGAIRVQSGSDETVVMDTCSFDGNTASTYGDAIYVHASKSLTLKGGTFANADNDIEFSGTMGHINISGAIQGVTVKYSKANHKGLIVDEAGIAGSDITITPKAYIKGHELVTKTEAASEATLKEAAKIIKITDNGAGLEWVVESDGTIDALGTLQTNVAQNKETGVKYTSIQAAVNAAKNGETIYVLYDMEVEKAITVSDEKNVAIANAPGKNITIIRAFEGSLFTVESGSILTIGSADIANTLTVDGGYDAVAAPALVNNAGTFNLLANATLQNAYTKGNSSNASNNGGALYNTGTANLAGNFTGNRGYNGGAVYNANGTLNITGGIYSGNIGAGQGGAVYVASGTDSATIANAEMTLNDVLSTHSRGVAIYLQSGASALTLENCNIHDNVVEYLNNTDIGSDVMIADDTTLNLKDNIDVGVVHQRYGGTKPYGVINVVENYTGNVVIVPNNNNFTVGVTQLVNYNSEMTADEKMATANQIVVRKVTDGVADDTTYCVDKNGILQYKGARIGTTVYNTLQDAVNAVESGLTETTVIEILYNTALSETIAITDSKNVTITNVAGSDITLTRTFAGSLFTVENGSALTLGSTDTTNTFVVDGGTVSGTSLVNNAGTFNLAANATIQNANAGSNKGGALYNTGTATLSGTMTGNTATHGGAVYNTGIVTVKAGTYSYNIATNGGGVIYSDSNASYVNVEAGTFEYNEAQGGTSGVIYGKATTTITGGTFKYNTAKTGGGVMNVAGSCTASISNVTMTGNALTGSNYAGGAIYVSGKGTLNVENSTISGNSADYKSNANPGCDISLGANVTFNLKNNTNIGVVQQRYTNSVATINVLEEYKTAIVFIPYNNVPVVDAQFVVFADTMSDEAKETSAANMLIRQYTSQTEYNDKAYYIDADGYVRQNGVKIGETYYKTLSEAVANVPTASEEATVIEVLASETLSETITLLEGQKVVLQNTTDSEMKLTRDAASAESMFVVVANSSLTIDGTSAIVLDGGYVETDTNTTIVKSLIQNAGTLTLGENVTVQNANTKATSDPGSDKNEYKGGALYNTGTVSLSSNFKGNTGWNGGAIYNNGGTLEITGGIYSDNIANKNGGAIATTSTTTINNAAFKNNTSTGGGGAVYCYASSSITLNITNTDFTENVSTGSSGGAVYCNKELIISGGTFYKNSASTYGGVVNVAGSADISGATMYENTVEVTNRGSAIYVSGSKTLVLKDCNIYNNETCDIRFYNTTTYGKATISNLTANDGDDSTTEYCYIYKSGSEYYTVPEQE